jgi:hypothetical protein
MTTENAVTRFVAQQVSADPVTTARVRRRRKKRILQAQLAEAALRAEQAAAEQARRPSGGRVPHQRSMPLPAERVAQLMAERSAARAAGTAARLTWS